MTERRKEARPMKVLSQKNQMEALKRIIANEIIVKRMVDIYSKESMSFWTQVMENNAELAYIIGGEQGMAIVKNELELQSKEGVIDLEKSEQQKK